MTILATAIATTAVIATVIYAAGACLCQTANIFINHYEPEHFPVATREEMRAVWDAEESAVMEAEIQML